MGGRHHQKYKDVKYISKYRYLRTFTHPFNLSIIVQRVRVRAWAKQRGGGGGGGGGGERQEKERSSRSALAALNEGLTLETSDFESLYGEQFTLSTQLIWPNYFPLAPPLPLHWRNTAVSLETCLLRSKNASRWHLRKNNRIFVHSACPRFMNYPFST